MNTIAFQSLLNWESWWAEATGEYYPAFSLGPTGETDKTIFGAIGKPYTLL